ncbi:MAG: response regulator [Chloroflexi bacterium]|nr:MAG: response regulator [Chloroflexota bacterium]
MGARSGSRARLVTVRRSTSPSHWPRSTRQRSTAMAEPMPMDGVGSSMVLVADDNEVAQRLCRRVLEKAGYGVLVAADGLQAVDLALAQNPNVILMDVAMPGMDGLEAMRRIKAERPEMRVVIASAHSMASDRERFLAAGADDVLSKPFRLGDLVAVVQRLTAKPGA